MPRLRKPDTGHLMLEEGLLQPAQLRQVRDEVRRTHGRFESAVKKLGILPDEVVVAFMALQLGIPHLGPEAVEQVPAAVARLLPDTLCRKYVLLPIARDDESVTIAVADPDHFGLADQVRQLTGLTVHLAVVPEAAILAAHERHLSPAGAAPARAEEKASAAERTASGPSQEVRAVHEQEALPTNMDELLEDIQRHGSSDLEVMEEPEEEVVDLTKLTGDAGTPIVKLVNHLIMDALRKGASDIHIEPYEKFERVRYRIDGVLHEQKAPPRKHHASLLSRIKIMANLNISERRLPQDGRIRAMIRGQKVDFRVSIIPLTYGEKAVLRVLSGEMIPVDQLGLEPDDYDQFVKLVRVPWGMILVSGPTSCGKSKTLTSALYMLNSPEVNISTIEDPVETVIEGINQVQAKPDIGLTFARGLRAFLRQDPNIMMVGEIRDKETAEVAINAALTGHTVFSTTHTKDAPGTITRLINMGVEPFLISSTLILAVSQRLVRRICVQCKEPDEINKDFPEKERPRGFTGEMTLYRGKGCAACNKVGYRGRAAIFEIMPVTNPIRDGVLARVSTDQVAKIAREHGMRTLRESGLLKAFAGITTYEEVLRETAADFG